MSDDALHCLTCGYNLTGLPENRCPECGEQFDPAELTYLRSKYGQFRIAAHLVECLQPLWAFWLAHAILLVMSLVLPSGSGKIIGLCSVLAILATLILGLISCHEVAASWAKYAASRYRQAAAWLHFLSKVGVGMASYAWFCVALGISMVIYAVLHEVVQYVFNGGIDTIW